MIYISDFIVASLFFHICEIGSLMVGPEIDFDEMFIGMSFSDTDEKEYYECG